MRQGETFDLIVSAAETGTRLDTLLADHLCELTRTHLSKLIRDGAVCVDGRCPKPSHRVKTGERITGTLPAPVPVAALPEPIPLDIRYEDEMIVVVNKPPGLVVHPSPGHAGGTLVNALLFHCKDLSGIGGEIRPGIVHRLDKDTSGLLVVAKNDLAHAHLAAQFKGRRVEKTYLALVNGTPRPETGSIALSIGRHPIHRKKMSTQSQRAKPAQTYYRNRRAYGGFSLLEVGLKTGRTHQIRVHCAAIGHPLVGDPVYGTKSGMRIATANGQIPVKRQMLHAWKLAIDHPASGKRLVLTAPLPPDMTAVLRALAKIPRLEP